jgi:hypothetical protein
VPPFMTAPIGHSKTVRWWAATPHGRLDLGGDAAVGTAWPDSNLPLHGPDALAAGRKSSRPSSMCLRPRKLCARRADRPRCVGPRHARFQSVPVGNPGGPDSVCGHRRPRGEVLPWSRRPGDLWYNSRSPNGGNHDTTVGHWRARLNPATPRGGSARRQVGRSRPRSRRALLPSRKLDRGRRRVAVRTGTAAQEETASYSRLAPPLQLRVFPTFG